MPDNLKKLIIHIPHSSKEVPLYDGYVVDKKDVCGEILKLTDWHTDALFENQTDLIIKANFSRVFCDVERFSNDEKEVMSGVGMGVIYTHFDSGKLMRTVSPQLRKHILDFYYWPHHNKLTEVVEECIGLQGTAFIVDCHSFADQPFFRDLNLTMPRPDINLGFDDFHAPSQQIIKVVVDFFNSKELTVGINWPYKGSIVPGKFYLNDRRVISLMVEVNRKLYLKDGSNIQKSSFSRITKIMHELLSKLRNSL